MPPFTYTPRTINDKSSLTPGMHPAFLVAIVTEPTPENWEMAKKSPFMLRWQFAVWDSAQTLTAGAPPERQSMVSSQAFTPKGNFQASKAYQWTSILLGREPAAGESVDLDPMLPLPCQLMVLRTDKLGKPTEYANLNGLFPWPDGAAFRTPEFCAKLAVLMAAPREDAPPSPPAPQPQYARPAQAATAPQAASAPPAGWPSTQQPWPTPQQPSPTPQPGLPGMPPAQPKW